MSINKLFAFYLTICLCIGYVAANGYYTIVAPKVLRPALDYHVSVSVHNVLQPVRMAITLSGRSDAGDLVSSEQHVFLQSEQNQVIGFTVISEGKSRIGMWGTGNYSMKVTGSGGINFFNETELTYEHKNYMVFIQTDKAIYKPGQPVLIRVIVVSPSLRPTGTERLDIFVTDGDGNRVKQWNRVFTQRGVFTTEMPLSDEPVLGDWNITVNILVINKLKFYAKIEEIDQKYQKSFTVAEYVLPSFDVRIDLPNYATFTESDIVATITAKYTYGKPVKGKAVIMVTPLVRSPQIRTYYEDPLRKTVEIDGKVDVPFNLQQELNIKDDYHRMVRFEVIVTESVTERRENATGVIAMFKYKEKIELIKHSETFKPGLKFSAFVKVADNDDIPVNDSTNPLIIRYGYGHDDSLYQTKQFKIPTNGSIELEIYPPLADNIQRLIIIAKYKSIEQYFPPIRRAESPSNTYIQAVLMTEKAKVVFKWFAGGEEVLIHVNSTAPMPSFNVVAGLGALLKKIAKCCDSVALQIYQIVLGRGDIVFADKVEANGQKTIAVKFVATNNMSPRTRFIIYYTTSSGEVVADGLSFEVEGVFRNFVIKLFQKIVDLKANKHGSQPGDTINFQVTTQPNSFVGLLAVDQSVLLLKSGNDVTQEEIIHQLELFDTGKQPKSHLDLIYSSIWFPGSATASEVFKDAGVMVMSNALVYEEYNFIMPRGGGELRPGVEKGKPVGDYYIPKEAEVGFRDPLDGSIIPIMRQHFPETWIWSNATAGQDGRAVFTREAPDTITSWVISAFSLDMFTGLAVSPSPLRVTIFRPFFISLNLPYAVIRNEAIAIQAVIFNYMKETIEVCATVTLENTNQFDFVTVEDVVNEVEVVNSKTKKVESGTPATVYFMIVPKELGYIDVKVTARSSTRSQVVSDSLKRKLLVKPEGVPQFVNKAYLIDLRSSSLFNASVNVSIPKTAVSGSERVEISTIADIMGPTVDNFDNLLQLPFGCGEQNMIRFVPNIVVIDYLSSIQHLTPIVKSVALTNMETGYQRQLTYKREDGSFSAFGNSDQSGSTWLTAFVMRAFSQAKYFIAIDEQVVNGSLYWLIAQQLENGSFPEVGVVSNKAIQGGSGKGLALTAYVLLAFVENKAERIFSSQMTKALRLLEDQIESIEDSYSLAIVSYTLHVINSGKKDAAFRQLQSKSISAGEFRYWKKNASAETAETIKLATPIDIEMTAYALMSYVLRNDLSGSILIMKWLITQRNVNGGFQSTQDTVVGIQALTMLAKRIVDSQIYIDVMFQYDNEQKNVHLDKDNSMILMKEEIPSTVKMVNITATGRGFAIVQVSYSYNIMVSKENPSFQVNPFVDRSSTKDRLQLNVCAAYAENGATSNMAVMEVTLPSGFVIDRDSLPALHRVDEVKRVDIKDRDTTVVVYFDKLDNKLVCPTIKAYRTYRVAKQKATAVYVYDYYDQAKAARYFFQAPQATLCDLCEGDECNSAKCRKETEERQAAENENSGSLKMADA
uniref:TEP1-F n=1 Tax=Strigamia maritima TaxID=126957 RepID=T1IYG2_STRMM